MRKPPETDINVYQGQPNPLTLPKSDIQHWVENLPSPRSNYSSSDFLSASPTARRRKLAELDLNVMDRQEQRRSSPRKRGRHHNAERPTTPNQEDTNVDVDLDLEATPRSNADSAPRLPSYSSSATQPPPLPPLLTSSNLSPSRSLASTTSSSSRTSQKTRSRSPTKRLGDLKLSDMPMLFKEFDDKEFRIPDIVSNLLDRMQDIAGGVGVVPSCLAKIIPSEYNLRSFNIAEDDLYLKPQGGAESPTAAETWKDILKIRRKAKECREKELAEPSWNSEVHSRIFDLALDGEWKSKGVWYRDVTTARTRDTSLLPQINESAMPSKMVDYSLILDPPSPNFQQGIIQTINSHKTDSINHTSAEFLRFNPIIASIETKRAAIDQDNANLQLAIWTSSSFSFLRRLVRPEVELLPHICILVLGHDWKLMVAQAGMTRADTAIMHMDILVGETSSILGICKLILCIRELAEWGFRVSMRWYEENVFQVLRKP